MWCLSEDGEQIGVLETEHLGFITREYQEQRIERSIEERKKKLSTENENRSKLPPFVSSNLAVQNEELKIKKELEELERFFERKIRLRGNEYPLEHYIMMPQEDNTYLYQLNISC